MASRDFRTRLDRRAARSNVSVPTDLAEQLALYYDLLARWNRKINLTALDDPDAAIDRLLLEPLLAVRHLPSPSARLMDVGSGGGSPAIPIKLAEPAVKLRMVEAKARKAAFLREACRHLKLQDAIVENVRYEALLARPELLEAHDALSVRAVRIESKILNTLQAFLVPGGVLMLFRGPSGSDSPEVVPPLRFVGTHPLVDTLQSRLTLLTKRRVGSAMFHVEQ